MTLRYPTVRLFVLNQLMSNSLTCGRAFVEGAYEFGLVSRGCLDPWLAEQKENGQCLLLPVARKTLEQFFTDERRADLESAWSAFIDQFEQHKSTKNAMRTGSTCKMNEPDCDWLAPMALDLMVQQMSRY